MIGAVEDHVVPEQARREVEAYIVAVVGTETAVDLELGLQTGSGSGERDGTTEGTVAVGRGTDTALDLG